MLQQPPLFNSNHSTLSSSNSFIDNEDLKFYIPHNYHQIKLIQLQHDGISLERISNAKERSKNISKLTCPLCKKILWKPTCCSTCKNSFCKHCLEDWLTKRRKCPNGCDFKEKVGPTKKKKILEALEISCVYSGNGCEEVVRYDALENHQNHCDFEAFQCKCGKYYCRNQEKKHAKECGFLKIKCEECEKMLKYEELASHNEAHHIVTLPVKIVMNESVKPSDSNGNPMEKKKKHAGVGCFGCF